MTLESPTNRVVVADRQTESVGAHVSTDPGVEGIDQFGTNTFRIRTWMESESHPVEVQPQRGNEAVEADTSWRIDGWSHLSDLTEDIETDLSSRINGGAISATDEDIETDQSSRINSSTNPIKLQEDVENDADIQQQVMEQPAEQQVDPPGEDDDLTITKTVMDPKPDPKEIVALSDDDEMDHRHSSDDDDNADLHQVEMKIVVGPKGQKIKVEKDWWKADLEAKERRIKR